METVQDIHLIIAGGYDERVIENKEYYKELVTLAAELGITKSITFLRSVSDEQKRTLLKYSNTLLYTPQNEHFGIVPVESMYMKCPVIALASGGPLETVVDGVTGYLSEPTTDEFAKLMKKMYDDKNKAQEMGVKGHHHVIEKFSFEAFTKHLDRIVNNLIEKKTK